jgi:hypothetical protein
LFPRRFLDASDCHLDSMSAMMTTCVGGNTFSHAHTFQISADDNVLLGMDCLRCISNFANGQDLRSFTWKAFRWMCVP